MGKALMRPLVVLCLFVVAACSTSTPSLTPAQHLYNAHGNYNIALGVAVNYAESNVANPAIVSRLRQANDLAAPAFRYAQAFLACSSAAGTQDPVAMAANPQCSGLDLSEGAVRRNASTLSNTAGTIFGLLRSAVANRMIGGN